MAKQKPSVIEEAPSAAASEPAPAPEPAPAAPQAASTLTELEALRAELAAERAKAADMQALVNANADLKAKIAELQAQALPDLPNTPQPGTYEVTLRHSPAKIKRLTIQANSEADAWEQFCKANIKALDNPKDPDRRELKAFERYCTEGKRTGAVDRSIKLVALAAAA